MKAEERKEMDNPSFSKTLDSIRQNIGGRTLYYILGTFALLVAAVLLWNYFSGQSSKAKDARLMELERADTTEKLKSTMEDFRGTPIGNLAKLQVARRALGPQGLEKLGTPKTADRRVAAASLEEARNYFLDLTKEFKEKDNSAILQECWLGAGQAEEALVGLPTTEGGSDSRGDADKAIEYYTKAASFFPESEWSKRIQKRVDELKTNKDKFISQQKQFYTIKDEPAIDPKSPSIPGLEGLFPKTGNNPFPTLPPLPEPPPEPKPPTPADLKTPEAPKTEVPKEEPKKAEEPKKEAEPKKTEEPKKAEAPKEEPKKTETKKEEPKAADPKSK